VKAGQETFKSWRVGERKRLENWKKCYEKL